MSWLLIVGLKNAILVAPLAFLAFGIGRYSKRPALAHVLWLIVLVKLLTPPLVDVPVVPDGWRIDVESLVATTSEPLPIAAAQPDKLPTLDCPAPDAEARPDSSPGAAAIANEVVCDPAPTAATVATMSAAPQTSWLRSSSTRLLRSSAFWLGLAGAVWLAGSAVALVLLVIRAWRFHRFVRLAARIDDSLAARVAALAVSLGLGRGPRVVVVDGVVSPMLWGVGRATRMIFPAKLADRLSGAEIDSLLLHELAHYARGDHWVRLLELVAHVLYWWHPVVWLARRQIEAAEEQCCDAWVVQHQHGSRRSYAEALLTTIDFLCEPQAAQESFQAAAQEFSRAAALPPAACGLGDVPLLRTRLTQIMRGQLATGLSRGVQAVVLSAGIVISPLQPASWATSSVPQTKPVAELPPPEEPRFEAVPVVASTNSSASIAESTPPAASTPEPAASPAEPPPRPAPLRYAALSPDGRYRLEERRTGVTLVRIGTGWRSPLTTNQILCSSFAPDGQFVTGHADGTIRWWDQQGGWRSTFGDRSGAITSIAFGANNRVAAGSSSGAVTVYDLLTSEEIPLNGSGPVACVRWSPDGERLAVGLGHYQDSQGALMIWDPRSNAVSEEFSLPQPVGALSWLNGSSLLIADWSGQTQVFDIATGELTVAKKVQKTLVSAANWSPDCPLITRFQADELARGAVR
jgi:beta-lactamase regulating signal transducer with metallopeptidase domain